MRRLSVPALTSDLLSLPMYSEVTEIQMKRVADTIFRALNF